MKALKRNQDGTQYLEEKMVDPVQVVRERKQPKHVGFGVPHRCNDVDVATVNGEPSMARQEFKDEVDINNIMKKYDDRLNAVPFTASGQYGDFSQITEFRDMLDTVIYAQEAFASLPASMRKRFGNDPALLLEFLQDEANYDEGVKLGLLQERHKPQSDGDSKKTTSTIKNKPSSGDKKGAKPDPNELGDPEDRE